MEDVKAVVGVVLMVLGIIGGIYVGGWLMFIQPILDACHHFDAGTLTGTIVGVTVLKCVFSGTVGWVIAAIGMGLGSAIIDS